MVAVCVRHILCVACYRVLCFFVFHICEGGGACVVIIYVCAVARVSPLTCNYNNVLNGAELRFRARNRYFLINLLIKIV